MLFRSLTGEYVSETDIAEGEIDPTFVSDGVTPTTIEEFAATSGYPAAFLLWLHRNLGAFIMHCRVGTWSLSFDQYAAERVWCYYIHTMEEGKDDDDVVTELPPIAMPKGLEGHASITPEFMNTIRQYFDQWVDDCIEQSIDDE